MDNAARIERVKEFLGESVIPKKIVIAPHCVVCDVPKFFEWHIGLVETYIDNKRLCQPYLLRLEAAVKIMKND